jgi:hypothetical protein
VARGIEVPSREKNDEFFHSLNKYIIFLKKANHLPFPYKEYLLLSKVFQSFWVGADADQTASRNRYGEFRFRRKFATCDPLDYRIEENISGIFYSDNGEGWNINK